MCGIVGYFAFNDIPSFNQLERATNSMFHRGPDANGFFLENKVGLGHRRLSIIDTSSSANQPFVSCCGQFVMVFNGEIYNFKEIAIELNIQMRTSSDSEVLLEAFIKLGPSFISRLNGMFSFAIYDKRKEQLYLYRDRLGIKPLYYYYDEKLFVFSSEIKALKEFDLVKESIKINSDSISAFLHLGYIPEPETIYSSIHQIKAGHSVVIDKNGIGENKYWDAIETISNKTFKDENTAIKELNDLIVSSVNYRLICDVPFGTFLSGGIDSSLVTAVACKLYPGKLKTFSIGFEENSHDESVYADNVANILKTDHHTFRVSEKDALQLVDESIELFDQPFSDSSAIPTLLVSRLAAKEVKMVLTGDGGDELFMGYGAYRWINRMKNPFIHKVRTPMSSLMKLGSSKYQRIGQLLQHRKEDDLHYHIFSQEQYLFSNKEIEDLLINKNLKTQTLGFDDMNFNRLLSHTEKQALFDLKHYLKDDLLVKVDRSSMKASLECRLPLLDYRLVEWSLNLDPSLKMKGNVSKYILKKVLYSYLPEHLFNRPKRGFAVPLSKWLKGPLHHMQNEYLSDEMIQKTGIFNKTAVSDLINQYESGRSDYLYNRIWALIVLQKMLLR